MLIVEGPDGAGKTTLVKTLSESFGWPVADRVVSKETAAMVNLAVWTADNLAKGFHEVIYDRHRLISDPIYRFTIPGKKMDPELYDLTRMLTWYTLFRRVNPLVIYCLPPIDRVKDNLWDDPDNEVVYPQIERIYYAYVAAAARDMANARSGGVWIYDYTRDDLGEMVPYIQDKIDSRVERERLRWLK